MTTPRRFESELPALLADLYVVGTPDYRDDLVRQTARVRQRPAWTFPERWLPVDLVTQRAPVTRMPWRQLGVLALIALLLGALLAVYIGQQTPKLPPPFGVAGNGLVAFAQGGDIFTVDPATGTAKAIVTGPAVDASPSFSRDGTKLLFLRKITDTTDQFRLMAAASDGSNVHVVREEPITANDVVDWSANGAAVLLTSSDSNITLYDWTGATPPTIVVRGARFQEGEIRPPSGAQILYEPDATADVDLWIMDADGANGHLVYKPPLQMQTDLDQVRWSPDGQLIGFKCAQPGDQYNGRICVIRPDGTGLRIVDTGTTGDWTETDFVWSPDGRSIAFNRWYLDPAVGTYVIQPIGLVDVASGILREVGPTPAPEGALFDFSPDGTTILSLPARLYQATDPAMSTATPVAIDVASGAAREVSWDVASDISWQRTAR